MRKLAIAMSLTSFFGFAQAHEFLAGQVWTYPR